MAASTLSRSERPPAVTQLSSDRYRHWPFRCKAPAPLLALVRPGGRIVMYDVTPLRALPDGTENPPAHDAKREFFFGTPQLVAAEVVLPGLENSLLVGMKVGG